MPGLDMNHGYDHAAISPREADMYHGGCDAFTRMTVGMKEETREQLEKYLTGREALRRRKSVRM